MRPQAFPEWAGTPSRYVGGCAPEPIGDHMANKGRDETRTVPAATRALDRALGQGLLDGTLPLDDAARLAVDEALGRDSTDRALLAAALLLAYDAGDDLGLGRSTAKRWVIGLDRLITSGHLEAAAHAAPQLVAAFPEIPFLVSMSVALRRLPAVVEDGREAFRDDRKNDVQVVPMPGADTVVLAFTGGGNKLGLSLNLMDRWLAKQHCHVVYLRDRQRVGYARGLPDLGPDLPTTIAGLSTIVRDLGAHRTVCIGTSAGATGALRYAPLLGAERVLALAPITGGPEYAAAITPYLQPGEVNPWDDLVPIYRHRNGVRVLVVYGDQNQGDRQQSLRMRGLPNVTVEAIHDWDSHHLIGGLLRNGQLQRVLRWLTSGDGVFEDRSGRVLALSRP